MQYQVAKKELKAEGKKHGEKAAETKNAKRAKKAGRSVGKREKGRKKRGKKGKRKKEAWEKGKKAERSVGKRVKGRKKRGKNAVKTGNIIEIVKAGKDRNAYTQLLPTTKRYLFYFRGFELLSFLYIPGVWSSFVRCSKIGLTFRHSAFCHHNSTSLSGS